MAVCQNVKPVHYNKSTRGNTEQSGCFITILSVCASSKCLLKFCKGIGRLSWYLLSGTVLPGIFYILHLSHFYISPTRSSLAGERKMVVTGNVVPLSTFMPDHHDTVLPRIKVVIWLVGPPVLKSLKMSRTDIQ